jgi:hypothetical protein
MEDPEVFIARHRRCLCAVDRQGHTASPLVDTVISALSLADLLSSLHLSTHNLKAYRYLSRLSHLLDCGTFGIVVTTSSALVLVLYPARI